MERIYKKFGGKERYLNIVLTARLFNKIKKIPKFDDDGAFKLKRYYDSWNEKSFRKLDENKVFFEHQLKGDTTASLENLETMVIF